MNPLMAYWQIRAGVIPGIAQPEHSRDIGFGQAPAGQPRLSGDELATLFERRREEALEYARSLMEPKRVNWVTLEFVWV